MHTPSRQPHALNVALAAGMLALCACQPTPEPPPPLPEPAAEAVTPAPYAKPIFGADAFILHLSLATLALSGKDADDAMLERHLGILQAYAERTPLEAKPQPLVILDYKTSGGGAMQYLAAPFSMANGHADFPKLGRVIDRLKSSPYVLYNVRAAAVASPQPVFYGLDRDAALQTLIAQMLALLLQAQPMPPPEDAGAQIALARFFLGRGIRDGAYLAIENAKHALAQSTGSETPGLIEDLETVEAQVRKAMPYTLSLETSR